MPGCPEPFPDVPVLLRAPSGSASSSATEHEAEALIGNSGIKRVQIKSPKMSLKVVSADSAGEGTVGSMLVLPGEQTKEG